MLEDLINYKVVLFGAGRNGELMLKRLISCDIMPMCFVDNDCMKETVKFTHSCGESKVFPVNAPEVLLNEEKSKLKIIITPSHHYYTEIESQINTMGLSECVYKDLTKMESISDAYWFSLPSAETSLPVPPKSIMRNGEPGDVHLFGGKNDFMMICTTLERNNINIVDLGRILDFGCSNCRILRHFIGISESVSLWGTDIDIEKIFWAMEHLPQLNLIVNDETPPLPFPDAFFGFIYAGSIFTHLVEYHTAWMVDLARITKPGGYLYITFHDELCVNELFNDKERFGPFLDEIIKDECLRDLMIRFDFDFLRVTRYRKYAGQVFMSGAYIEKITSEFFSLIEIIPCAYAGFQTAYLFKRKHEGV
jgi:SAM-dependent methyltransferase